MHFSSLEVRWFVEGTLDPVGPEVEWFRHASVSADQGAGRTNSSGGRDWPDRPRVDTYLSVLGRDDIGIKARREVDAAAWRDEFKGRIGFEPDVGFGPVAVGRVERWIKWSWSGGDGVGAAEVTPAASTHRSVRVSKWRLLRRFRIASDGRHREVADVAMPMDRGIGVELTRLDVGGRPWWTLGFEAFPAGIDLAAEFTPMVSCALDGAPFGGMLDSERSYGYPAWLGRILVG